MFFIRSQDLNSDGGTAIQLYSEYKDGTTNSAAGRFQRGKPSGSGSDDTVAKSFSWMKNRLAPWGELIACLSVIVFDPLLFYVVVVNEDKKCLSYVKNQGIMIGLVLRSVSDFLFLIYFTVPRWIAFRENKRKLQNCYIFVYCVFFNLPFTQVFMIILLANNISNLVPKDLIISQVLGCFWYIAAVVDKLESWKKACKNHTGCVIHDLYCNGDSFENFIPNTTTSDFGVYKEIIQYDILETTDFPRKLLFCLRWGCQNICSFGQSLQTNGEPVQDLIVIEVIIFSIFLFVLIIGIIQTNKQSDAVRVERRKLNIQHIRSCMLIRKLSENLQRQYHNFRNAKTGGSARRRTTTNYLREGDFCGEELLAWFQADPYSSGLPISTKTIVALTNVLGFALMSDDLITILIKHHAALFIQSYWQKRQAARPIQLSLRRSRNTQTYIQEQTPSAESFEISIENA
ncbi:hypothetical protein QYF36_012328 [Acer negundo]|nr:hypothetical protein QYF36_012328 [Acer negundo]